MAGRFAISTTGKDAGKIYIIVGKEKERLLLADGVKYRLVNPKKKNCKHVTIPKQEVASEFVIQISEKRHGCDEAIRQYLHHLKKDNLR